jgi:hypothetical protein
MSRSGNYKNVEEYLYSHNKPHTTTFNNYSPEVATPVYPVKDIPKHDNIETFINEVKQSHKTLNAELSISNYNSTSNPQFWGSSFWLILHNGALRYPEQATPLFITRMKGFIKGIPYMIPCHECKQHAIAFIDSRTDNELNEICSGRDKLFKFYVDFHNKINIRYNKPIMSYEDAYKLYSGKVKLKTIKYT